MLYQIEQYLCRIQGRALMRDAGLQEDKLSPIRQAGSIPAVPLSFFMGSTGAIRDIRQPLTSQHRARARAGRHHLEV